MPEPIRIGPFGGIMPRTQAALLPDGMAQVARDCRLTGGALTPLTVTEPFASLHTEAGLLESGIPAEDLKKITKPDAPAVSAEEYYCDVTGGGTPWLGVVARTWVQGVIAGEQQTVCINTSTLTLIKQRYTETGLRLTYWMGSWWYDFFRGGPHCVRGPRYQFLFGAATNGPDEGISCPRTPTISDPELPGDIVPLYRAEGQLYARFQVADVSGPRFDEDILVTDFDTVRRYFPGSVAESVVSFDINLNYTVPSRRHYYYVQTMRTSDDEEGPPSELSELITVKPGQKVTLSTPRADDPEGSAYPKNRLYRSATGNDDFLLVDDVDADTYTDERMSEQAVALPKYGNYPDCPAAQFLEGSVIHPGQFGVAYYGDTLYFSDPFRLWAWPEEWTIPFTEDIRGLALSGGTVLVFTATRVYAIAGSHPEAMAKYDLGEDNPLLSKLGLCRLGGTVLYPSYDGLIAISGSDLQVVTGPFYTREDWLALAPATMTATTADGAVFLECADGTKLRVALGDSQATVTTYTVTDGSAAAVWKSKVYQFDQKTAVDYVRVSGAAGTVTVWADGTQKAEFAVNADEVTAIPYGAGEPSLDAAAVYAHRWEFQVTLAAGTVTGFTAHPRVVHAADQGVALSPADTASFKGVVCKFAEPNRFAAGYVTGPVHGNLPVALYQKGTSAAVYSGTVTEGRPFALPRTLTRAAWWSVTVGGMNPVDQLVLMPRQTAPAGKQVREVYDGGVCPWLVRKYTFQERVQPQSLTVYCTGSLTANVYADGAATATKSVSVTNGAPVDLGDMAVCKTLEIDFSGSDYLVSEFALDTAEIYAVGQDPLVLDGGLGTYRLQFGTPGRVAALQVVADQYTTITVTVKVDGVQVLSQTVTSGAAVKMPRTVLRGYSWTITVTPSGSPLPLIHRLVVYPQRTQLLNGPVHVVQAHGIVPEWVYTRYELVDKKQPASVVCLTTEPVTTDIYADDSATPTATVTLADRVEADLNLAHCGVVEVQPRVDASVNELFLFPVNSVAVNGPVVMERPVQQMGHVLQFQDAGRFMVVTVDAADYTGLTVTLTSAEAATVTASPTSAAPALFGLSTAESRVWRLSVSGGPVRRLVLYPETVQGVAGVLVSAGPSGAVPPWLYTQYVMGESTELRSGVVISDAYPVTLQVYADGASSVSKSVTVADSKEFLIEGLAAAETFRVRFAGEDNSVRGFSLYPKQNIQVSGPVRLDRRPWRGLFLSMAGEGTWRLARALNAGGTLTLKADGAAGVTRTVAADEWVSLPRSLTWADRWTLDFSSTGEPHEIGLWPLDTQQASADGLYLPARPGGPMPWDWQRYQFGAPTVLASGRVAAESYPVTVSLYCDGATTATDSVVVTDAREFRIDGLDACTTVEIHTTGAPSAVALFAQQAVQGDTNGVVLTGPNWRNRLVRWKDPNAPAVVRVAADDYTDMTLRVYRAGVLVATETIADGREYLLDRTFENGREWTFDLDSARGATALAIGTRTWHQVVNGAAVIRREGDPWFWQGRRVFAARPVSFSAGRVLSDAYPVRVRLWTTTEQAAEVGVAGPEPFRWPRLRPERQWEFDVIAPEDAHVQEVALGVSMEAVRG